LTLTREQYAEAFATTSTAPQIAADLGITRRRVAAIARSRGLGTMVGNQVLFTPQEVAEFGKPRLPGRPATGEPSPAASLPLAR
jgi:hypothetical protein